MTVNAHAHIATTEGSRYLQRLCKHWRHNLDVTFTPQAGTVIFPRNARGADWPGDARLLLQAHPDHLECRLEASAPGQLDALKMAVTDHLQRFAFREGALGVEWKTI